MNHKFLIVSLLSLFLFACSELPKSKQTVQTIERFEVQNDLVTDTQTGLMWTRCLLGATWNGTTCAGKATGYGWQEAQDTVKKFNHAGFNNWRIPTLEELKTLADKETETAVAEVKIPHINESVFPTPSCLGAKRSASHHDGHSCWQWSATEIENSKHYLWIVYFGYGYGSANYEADVFALRLVRDVN